ncbi:MAG: DNA repair protein RecN [Candidatus Omnitrophica bacterium]|nr:DNA repair protein RecN [Candidatus Omnitrophota bacterium]
MLRQLTVKNFALIDRVSLEFSPHLNVLTGETGAGKSILIDAIRFVLGEKIDGAGAGSSAVEAVFELSDSSLRRAPALEPYFESEEDDLILRRETADGRSRASINGRSVNVSALREAGRLLLDIHGQYDHQLLLDPKFQMEMIDRLGGNAEIQSAYAALFMEYREWTGRRAELAALEERREREIDLVKYQIDEIERGAVEEGEEESLREEKIRLANAEKLFELAAAILSSLNENSPSASALLGSARRSFADLARIDESMARLQDDFQSAEIHLEEIIRSVEDYKESLSFEPARLDEIQARLEVIDTLKRKYGGSAERIGAFLSQARRRYDELVNSSVLLQEIDAKLARLGPEMKKLASLLSEKRKKAGVALRRVIETEMKDLGVASARFECRSSPAEPGPDGADQLEFLISLNVGEPVAPLRRIVSGGEVSRVMLALKRALMKVDPMPSLIFDEIDANIGGRLGSVTGRKLKEISEDRQVLLITHLPQIASFADRHFKVFKKVAQGKTVTEYRVVEGDERVSELAQMMSGRRETEASRRHAEEMLSKSAEG